MAQESALFPFRAFSGQLEETNHTRIGVDDYDSNSDGSVSHLGLITHLADGLPDPPDDISGRLKIWLVDDKSGCAD